MKLNGLQKISLNFHGISALGFIVNHRVSKDIHRCWVVHSEFLGRKFVVPLLTRPKGIRKHKNPLNMPRVLDKLLILVPGFCKHTTMVCFVCSYSVGFVGEWYHFSLFLQFAVQTAGSGRTRHADFSPKSEIRDADTSRQIKMQIDFGMWRAVLPTLRDFSGGWLFLCHRHRLNVVAVADDQEWRQTWLQDWKNARRVWEALRQSISGEGINH